jgi:flagellar hook-associated protein 2
MATTLFNGTSRFSQDFLQVIDRSVAIASLPLKQLQQQRLQSSDESTALKTIEAKVLALQAGLIGIDGSLQARAWQSSSSDYAVVRPLSTEGVAEGTYTLQVKKFGVSSTALSTVDPDPANRISDPAAGSFVTPGSTALTLTMKDWDTGTTTVLDPATLSGGSLQDVVKVINEKFGTKVKAAIVNLGTTDSPNFQLSVQSTSLGKVAIQLNDGSRDLMNVDINSSSDGSLGELAEYSINGATLTSNSRKVTLAPKLTAELLSAQPGKDVTISVTKNTATFKNSLNAFITSFNSLAGELDQQAAGSLKGNSLVTSIRQQLREIISMPLSDGVGSMANIGLEFTKDGEISLNNELFDQATAAGKLESLTKAIGSATTSGFLKTATDALATIEGATGNGLLQSTIKTVDESVKAQDARIQEHQNRIDQLTRDLEIRMGAADALIAQLEQQANYFTNMFETMRENQKSY